jgi:hypothetical protein
MQILLLLGNEVRVYTGFRYGTVLSEAMALRSVFLSGQARPASMKLGRRQASLQNRGWAGLGLQATTKPGGRQGIYGAGFSN